MASQFLTCSNRLARVQKPIIPIIAGLIRENPGTISLGQGVVHFGPPSDCFSKVGEFAADPENNKYKPVQGLPALVEAVQTKLAAENGITCATSRIFITAGGNLAFMNALLAIADPGDEVILQTPYYFNHEMAITMGNCRPVLIPTDSRYQLQVDQIQAAITNRTRAIVTVSPNNPTGAVYSKVALQSVNRICLERGIYHIHDEAYEYFTYDGAEHFSPASDPVAANHTISLFSLSKAFGFASWRIGYMVVPQHLIEAVNKVQDTLIICAPVISQFAALAALNTGKKYFETHRPSLEGARNIVLTELQKLGPICEAPPTVGAFYFFLKINTRLSSMEMATRLVKDFKVAVIPGNAFGIERGCFLRLAYGALKPETALAGVGRLVGGLQTLANA